MASDDNCVSIDLGTCVRFETWNEQKERARLELEKLFDAHLMNVFKIETMNIPRDLADITINYFFKTST